MLRRYRALLIALIIAAALSFVLPIHSTSTTTLRRITFTSEHSLNLNVVLSRRSSVVAFESTSDIADLGAAPSFHAMKAAISDSDVSFNEFAKSRAAVASISHDGSVIAFSSSDDLINENSDRNLEIYLSSASGLRQLTHTSCVNEESRLIDGNFEPSINGDGTLIVFSSSVVGEGNTRNIYIAETTTGKIQQLTRNTDNALSHSPKISADGSLIYFIRDSVEGVRDLMLFDRSTAQELVLEHNVPDLMLSDGPALSDDGMRLVYAITTALNQTQVQLYDRRFGVSRQLTHLPTRATDVKLAPAISGDGLRVSFATRRRVVNSGDGSVELYLIDLPTGEIQQITNAPAGATAEILSSLNADGSLVAFNFPRVLSGPVNQNEFANNSEIYLATISPRPAFGAATVQNAAAKGNERGAENLLARGSLGVARGTNLSVSTKQINFNETQTSTSILGTTVQVNGVSARLLYVSPDEVVFVVPEEIAPGDAEIVVANGDGFKAKANAMLANGAPGVFTVGGDGRGAAVALNADNLLPGPFDPSTGQLRITLFCTGLVRASQISVDLGGFPATVEALQRSNVPGIDELHLLVPDSLRGAGPMSVVVRADGAESNPATVTFSGSARRDLMINEFLADPPDGDPGDANHDGIRDSSDDEFVEIINTTTRDLDLSGFQLQTRSLTGANDVLRHRFAEGTVVSAGTAIVVFGGGSIKTSDPVFGGAQVVSASARGLGLNNSGGVITLRDSGGMIVTTVTYGTAINLLADQNQSLTRLPDLDGPLALHTVAAGSDSRFSPGTRVDGTGFVPAPAVVRIVLNPVSVQLMPGGTQQFSAVALDHGSSELTGVIFGWHSSKPEVLQINSNGLAQAISAGTVEVSATARGIESLPSIVTVVNPTPTPTPTPSPSPTPTPNSSPSPAPSPTVPASIVISEFRTRGPNGANDEFVEIYNKGTVAVQIGGWKLRGSSSAGTITTRMTISSGTILPARTHFLATNSGGYSGTVVADQSYSSGFANDGGIALTRADDIPVDQVGLSSGSAFREGMHLPPLVADANQGYERKPDGLLGNSLDTQDNLSDFQLLAPSDPQNMHTSAPAPSPSPSPSPTATPTPSATPTATPTPAPSPTPSVSPTPTPSPSPTTNKSLVISQIFGGGGNSGAPFRNDFIEIFNRGTEAIDLSGWSIQYASATNTNWSSTPLTPVVLSPGSYYLIQEASGGTNGIALPGPDVVGSIAMAATAGKVALVRTTTGISGLCPSDSTIVDLVGYGSSASCFRGSAPAVAPSNSNAILRGSAGCTDAEDNHIDFITGPPAPRNLLSPTNICGSANAPAFHERFRLVRLDGVISW
jgi:uncharacterized protein (TIGR03437 family)